MLVRFMQVLWVFNFALSVISIFVAISKRDSDLLFLLLFPLAGFTVIYIVLGSFRWPVEKQQS